MITGIIVFVLLLAAQIVFLCLPDSIIFLYTYIFRPFTYASALSVVLVFYGVDKRPIPKRQPSILLAGFGVLIYCVGFLIAGFAAGFAHNHMTNGFSVFIHQLWIYGAVVVMSEILRSKLIRGTPANRRNVLAVILTLAFTAIQLDELRSFIHADGTGVIDFLFSDMLPALMLNIVLTYIAYESALSALLLLRVVYCLTPVFMPVLPRLSGVSWAVIECVMLFITVVMYHFHMSGQHREIVLKIKRQAKYQKQSISLYIVTTVLATLLIAFQLRAFAYYPTAVVTGSMTGSIDVGTMVLIEKVSAENGIDAIKQGDVLLYKRENIEVLHRVIDIGYNAAGERVYITKGDANTVADAAPVEQGQILGVSRLCIRYLGYPTVWLQTFFN